MYEYLLENLISYSQVDGNLRRAAKKGLVSELYRKQMNALALKYFGVDSNGNYTENKEDIVAYRCPYSGETINDLSTVWLEHILPFSSNGGTVLFNCIPILDKVNRSKLDEPNLLTWWQEKGKEYFSYDRLERLIQYMLEAYTLAFKEPTEDELYDYNNSLNNEDCIEKKDDLSIDLKDKTSKKNITNIHQNITYYQLISDLINELSKNRDVSKYNSQLNNLKEKNIFGNIEELEKLIKSVQTIFREMLEENSKNYLSYSLKIDMNKMLKSFKTKNYEFEIRKRFNYIKSLLNENNISLNDYFNVLDDIESINLIYFDISDITENMKNNFIENIRISHDTKIMIFIEMIKMTKTEQDLEELFKHRTTKQFTTYKQAENGNWIEDKTCGEIGSFWSNNKDKINLVINELVKTDIELRDKLDNYYMNTLSGQHTYDGKQRRINVFIEMIKRAKTEQDLEELFNVKTNKQFTTYKQAENGNWIEDKTYGEIGQFWRNNKDKINLVINELVKTDIELRDKLDNYYMNTRSGQLSDEGKQRRINIFIEMIKRAKTEQDLEELFNIKTNKQFTTYKQAENGNWIEDKTYGEIGSFWSSNKDKINLVINELVKTNIELRDKLDNYYMNTRSGQLSDEGKQRRIKIFIEMIRRARTEEELEEIFKDRTNKQFTTYKKDENGQYIEDKTYGKIARFSQNNKTRTIIPKLFFSMEYSNEEYDIARQNIMNYLNLQRRKKKQPEFKNIDEYIDTLDKTKKEVKSLIELRDSLLLKKEQLILENQELTDELNSSYRRTM